MADPQDTDGAHQTALPTPSPPPTAARRAGWAGPVLGGLIATVLGFGAAQVAPRLWPAPEPAAPAAELTALMGEVAALKAQLAGLAAPPPTDPALLARLAALEARKPPPDLSAELATLEARLQTLAQAPAAAAADAGALQALQAQIDALAAAPAPVPAAIDAAVAQAQAELSRAVAAARAQTEALARQGSLRQIAAALDSGAPYAAALTGLAGQEVPSVLAEHAESGLPSLTGLQAAFPDAARAALAAARSADMGASWSERVTTFLQAQTGARSLAPRTGNDPDAVLSRAEAALAQADLARALAELSDLPPAAQPALAEWVARAALRLEAQRALEGLVQAMGG